METTSKGRIRISRTDSNQRDPYITVTLRNANGRIMELVMEPASFALAITGMEVECEFRQFAAPWTPATMNAPEPGR